VERLVFPIRWFKVKVSFHLLYSYGLEVCKVKLSIVYKSLMPTVSCVSFSSLV